jgi:Site-specific recombinases, DNA invertase Pin homologs
VPKQVESAIRVVRQVIRCFIYARISEDREGAHLATERQTDDCRELAERLSTPAVEYRVVQVFEDNDLSAYSGKPRPRYQAMLEALRNNEADCVLAWHTDRLHRSPTELERYIDVCAPAAIPTRTVKAGDLDLSTATGRMIARQLGVQARYEVERMIERSKRARDQKATHGEYAGGPRPFGYEDDGVTPRTLECPDCGRLGPKGFTARQQCDACEAVDRFSRDLVCQACEAKDTLVVVQHCARCDTAAVFAEGSEAALIRDAADSVLAGASLNALATAMAEAGVTTSHGRDHRGRNLRVILLRPRNAGLLQHRGEIVGRANWARLMDEPVWRSMAAILEDPSRIPSVPNTRKHLGSNIYECGVCGATLKASSKSNGRGRMKPVYRCRDKDCVTRNLQDLDDYVQLIFLQRIMRPDAAEILLEREEPVDVKAIQRELRAARETLDELAAALGAGEMDRQEWLAARAPARRRLEDAEARMSSAVKTNPLAELLSAEDPVAKWKTLDLSRKRAAIDYAVTVRVGPARMGRQPGGGYFDADSVEVVWK